MASRLAGCLERFGGATTPHRFKSLTLKIMSILCERRKLRSASAREKPVAMSPRARVRNAPPRNIAQDDKQLLEEVAPVRPALDHRRPHHLALLGRVPPDVEHAPAPLRARALLPTQRRALECRAARDRRLEQGVVRIVNVGDQFRVLASLFVDRGGVVRHEREPEPRVVDAEVVREVKVQAMVEQDHFKVVRRAGLRESGSDQEVAAVQVGVEEAWSGARTEDLSVSYRRS